MKKILIFLMTFLPMMAKGYDVEINGIYYNIIPVAKSVEVTYGDRPYVGSITIPESIEYKGETYNVTSVGYRAFWQCSELISVVVPQSINSIGASAFHSCQNLSSVSLSDGLTNIGSAAFRNCNKLQEIVIPNTVVKMEDWVFADCTSINSISLSNNLEYISGMAFWKCYSLKNIRIPHSVTSIWGGAFEDCTGLETLVMPDEVNYIDMSAFAGCSNLKELTLGKGIVSIGEKIISGCKNLSKIICYASAIPSTHANAFAESYVGYMELYVPNNLVADYTNNEIWNQFGKILPIPSESDKCATPSISYANGKLSFTCETEGAECVATISDTDIKTHYGNEISLTATYTISVYATAPGYDNSDIATATLCWINAAPRTEGMTSIISQARGQTALIQCHDGTLNITGLEYGTKIDVYTSAGILVGAANVSGTTTLISTGLGRGQIAIVKIGESCFKMVIR